MQVCLKEGLGILEEWMSTHFVPSLANPPRIAEQVSLLLAKPMLWACFDDRLQSFVPVIIRDRICTEYTKIRLLDEGVNSGTRVLLIVSGRESGEVHFDEVVGLEELIDATVTRVLLIVSGREGEVHFDEVVGLEELIDVTGVGDKGAGATGETGGGGNLANVRSALASNLKHFRALYSQNLALRREVQ